MPRKHNFPDDPVRVRQLLKVGADVNVRNAKGKTVYHRAVQAGFPEIPNLFLQSAPDINCPDANGEPSLFDAVRAGRVVTVEVLLKAGADMHVKSHQGKSILDLPAHLRGSKRDTILDLFSSFEKYSPRLAPCSGCNRSAITVDIVLLRHTKAIGSSTDFPSRKPTQSLQGLNGTSAYRTQSSTNPGLDDDTPLGYWNAETLCVHDRGQ